MKEEETMQYLKVLSGEMRSPMGPACNRLKPANVTSTEIQGEQCNMYLKNRNLSFPKTTFIHVLLLLFASTLNAQSPADEARAGQWRIAGHNLSNTWSQPAEHSISPSNAAEQFW
jgi:hypothetical protein